jgi:23S rRNA (guanine1835-N2)-methyltransferase
MSATETTMQVPQGCFALQRRPRRRRELLRAWDAADEYLLREVAAQGAARQWHACAGDQRQLWCPGGCPCALGAADWSDSFLSQLATRDNLLANGIDPADVTLLNSLQQPAGPVDLVLIKVPKTLALLEDQLTRLRPLLTADTRVLVAGMVKALPRSVWALLERACWAPPIRPWHGRRPS